MLNPLMTDASIEIIFQKTRNLAFALCKQYLFHVLILCTAEFIWKFSWFLQWSLLLLFIIGIQLLGRSGQRPEFSQATGMALVRCILGKFLGVACHCFPPLFRFSHFSPPGASTSTTTWEIPAAEVGTVGENFAEMTTSTLHLGIFYMLQIYNMGPTALLPLRRKVCWRFFCP